MQIDERGVVVGAVRRLVQALTVEGQARPRGGEPARSRNDIPGGNAAEGGRALRRAFARYPL